MTFQENLNRIYKEQGTYLTNIVKNLGLSTSKVSRWNNGSLPKQEILQQLAEQLNCTVADFFIDPSKQTLSPVKPNDEDEEEILRIYRSLSRRNKHEFMTMIYDFEKSTEQTKTAAV